MAEGLKAAVLKTVSGVTHSGVRIPLPPPYPYPQVPRESFIPEYKVFGPRNCVW